MTDVERECRAAWFKAIALWIFADYRAERIERAAYLAEYGIEV